jgi:hypothetical protein
MKLCILYTTWTGDDMDMLKSSMEFHAPFVEGIILGWQVMSNKGNIGRNNIPVTSANVRIDYFCFSPNLSLNTKENERQKHNQMIQMAKKLGYTHFILSAGDHFYNHEQLQYARQWHLNNPQVDLSITKMITYYKSENWCLYPLESYGMPFIHKLKPETEISRTAEYPIVVDPSVKVNTSENIHVFNEKDVLMHHYSMIRKDIRKKFANAAASIRWTEKQIETFVSEYENAKLGDQISYFGGLTLVRKEQALRLINVDWNEISKQSPK